MSNAAQAYSRTSQTTASPREIEAQALLKAARQLQDVQANWAGPDKNMRLLRSDQVSSKCLLHIYSILVI